MRSGIIQQRRENDFFRRGRDYIAEANVHLHPNSSTLDGVSFDTLMQGVAGETNDPQANFVCARTPCLVAEGQPDLMRILRRQAVKIEGGEQADDAVGNLLADLSQRVVFGDVRTGRAIKLLI